MEYFAIKVFIDGQDLEQLGIQDSIFSIEVIQDEDKTDVVILDIWNRFGIFTDSNIFRERAKMIIMMGLGDKMYSMGKYILQKPTYGFPEKDAQTIRLIGFDEGILLKEKGEKRIVFKSSTDSEIASQIASQNGLIPDVQNTTERRDQEAQINETDLKFLHRLAKRNGFILYVENSTLHFHPVRYEDSGLELIYGQGENVLIDFWPSKTLIDSAGNFISTFLDKDLGTVLTARSTNIPDAIDIQDRKSFPTSRGADTLIPLRPNKYVPNIDTSEDIQTNQGLVNRLQQEDSYIVGGWGKAHGNPNIKIRRTIKISSIGHLSGLYYIRSTCHKKIEGQGYMTTFFASRSRYGPTKRIPSSASGGQSPSIQNRGQEIQPEIVAE